MIIANELRKKNIAEYLLYMWQIEDTIRAFDCSLRRIRDEYVSRFDYTEEQKEEEIETLQMLIELHEQLLQSPKFPFYNTAYYKVLPFIVELRNRGANKEENEIETCFNSLYGVMLLRLRKKDISPETAHAVKEISTFIGMLSDYYHKDKEEGLKFE